MIPVRPRILLVGAGRFGTQHLLEWLHLVDDGTVDLVGVVARRDEVRASIHAQYGVATFADLDDQLLEQVDAVDIVTPPDTHAELIRRCLPHAHVLVEKPLASDADAAAVLRTLAADHDKVLMVGHIFRFHAAVIELKRLVSAMPELPRAVNGTMINPEEQRIGRGEANLELLHLFDIVDYIFDVEPTIATGRKRGSLNHVSLRYPGPMNAVFCLGWRGEQRLRTLELLYIDRRIMLDLIDNSIVVSTRNNQLTKSFFPDGPSPLNEELRAFVAALNEPRQHYPDATVGERIVRIALSSSPRPVPRRPSVAVIGGGIFGTSCALELSSIADVTLYERHAELLTETSATNQRRHHSGFHYPRSYDSIVEIRTSRRAFEEEFGDAIDRSCPAYYCPSATGIEIPAERYLAACQSNNLEFSIVDAPSGLLNASAVSLCLLTDEALYNVERLRRIVTERLTMKPNVQCRLRTTVISGVLASDGSKHLTESGPDGTRDAVYDYVVNATYAGRNLMAQWFGFPVEPLRFDLFEILQLRLPIPQVSATILDGPFTSLTGTGIEDIFLLSHIHDSVSRSVIPDDGMPPLWTGMTSNRANMLRHSERYFPVLRHATDVQSLWMTRAVNAFARDFDARPTVITDHGFGCWSVLGGKMVTCVTNAREISRAIQSEQHALFDHT